MVFQPGTELFTLRFGEVEQGWKPFGYGNTSNLTDAAERRTSIINRNKEAHSAIRPGARLTEANIAANRNRLLADTSPNKTSAERHEGLAANSTGMYCMLCII